MVAELFIRPGPTTSDLTARDRWSGELAADLRHIDGVSAGPVDSTAPAGPAKGILAEIGTIAVAGVFSAATLKLVGDVVVAFLQRSTAGVVTVKHGDTEVSITGLSPSDTKDAFASIEKLLTDRGAESTE